MPNSRLALLSVLVLLLAACSPAPTPTLSATATLSPLPTPSATNTATLAPTPQPSTATPVRLVTPTRTATAVRTRTPTLKAAPTATGAPARALKGKIAYSGFSGNTYLMSADGSNSRVVASGRLLNLSLDGTRLLFVNSENKEDSGDLGSRSRLGKKNSRRKDRSRSDNSWRRLVLARRAAHGVR